MGADITFYKGKKKFYFRDSYNPLNLAWVIGLSYWQVKRRKNNYIDFFKQLSEITDSQIEARVDFLFNPKKVEGSKKGWVKMFKEARQEIRDNLKIIIYADKVEWSV